MKIVLLFNIYTFDDNFLVFSDIVRSKAMVRSTDTSLIVFRLTCIIAGSDCLLQLWNRVFRPVSCNLLMLCLS